jgi:hypothetical protein
MISYFISLSFVFDYSAVYHFYSYMCLGHYGVGWESEFEIWIGKDMEGSGRALFQLTHSIIA